MSAEVIDRTGYSVDTSGRIWQLRGGYRLNFKPLFARRTQIDRDLPCLEALKRYFRHSITIGEPGSQCTELFHLSHMLRRKEVREALLEPDATFLIKAHEAMKALKWSDVVRTRALVTCRKWYAFAVDEGLDGFEADAVFAMRATMIGKATPGIAVRRLDPDDGPLHEAEATALETALKTAFKEKSLPINEVALGLIFLLLGPNPENVRRLDESDLESKPDEDGQRYLNIPRIKKGLAFPRQEFKRRPVEPLLLAVLEALIEHNRQAFPKTPIDDGSGMPGRPLFAWQDPQAPGHPRRHSRGWHCRSIKALPAALNIHRFDPAEGDAVPLRLVPRRLRYTFAKRQVMIHKALPDVLADLLDHSSLQTVLVYYDPGMDLVDALDDALGDRLAPFVKVALGHARAPRRLNEVAIKSLLDAAPGGCLTCRRFQPSSPDGLDALMQQITETKKGVRAAVGAAGRSHALLKTLDQLDVRACEVSRMLKLRGATGEFAK